MISYSTRGDIAQNRGALNKIEALKDHADVPANHAKLLAFGMGDRLAVNLNFSLGNVVKTINGS
ncbi:hypothetical protein D3C78_1206750 [compost metagenome]